MPAIPLHTAVTYVAGAYLVFFALILAYVAIMATKLGRIETELSELTELAVAQRSDREPPSSGTPPIVAGTKRQPPAVDDAAESGGPKLDQPKTGALAG